MKNGKEATAEECLIQRKFFYLSSLEWLGNAAYPIYDKDYIRTLIMQGFLKDKLFEKLHFFSDEETDGQTLNIENFRGFLFPDELNIDIQNKDWQFWVSLYEQAVQLDQECKKISEERIQAVKNNKEMNFIYKECEIQEELAPFETIYRLLWLPRLVVSIDDLEVVLRHNSLFQEAQEIEMLIDKCNKPIIDKTRKRQSDGGKNNLLKEKKFFDKKFRELQKSHPSLSSSQITTEIWASHKDTDLENISQNYGRATLGNWQKRVLSNKLVP